MRTRERRHGVAAIMIVLNIWMKGDITAKFVDLTGERFGKWTVLRRGQDGTDKRGYPVVRWVCKCDCGTVREVIGSTLKSGRSKSCGCSQYEHQPDVCRSLFTTHGESKTRLYKIWAYMKKRCENANSSNYHLYGARGIKVCDEWSRDYTVFREWAIANGYKDDLSIDRIDPNGDYCPSNCRWADMFDQANNRRSNVYLEYNGRTMTMAQWARELNVPYYKICEGHSKGESLEQILGICSESKNEKS